MGGMYNNLQREKCESNIFSYQMNIMCWNLKNKANIKHMIRLHLKHMN